jgi:Ca2+-binding RTX toxin-like protein
VVELSAKPRLSKILNGKPMRSLFLASAATTLGAAISVPNANAVDLPAGTTTTARLTLTKNVDTFFERAGDEDWFKVSLSARTRYKFGIGGGDIAAPSLKLFKADGRSVVASTTAKYELEYRAAQSGTYFLSAKAFPGDIGQYRAELFVDNEAPNSTSTARMSVGTSFRSSARGPSNYDCGADQDWIGVNLTASKTYSARLDYATDGHELTLRNATGGPVPALRQFGFYSVNGDQYVQYTCFFPASSALYYVDVNVYDACGDEYTLTLSEGCPIGTEFADTINGTPGADEILALEGDDRINTFEGNDVVWGGPGNDFIDGGPGSDQARWLNDGGPQGVIVDLLGIFTLGVPGRGEALRYVETGSGTITEIDTLIDIEDVLGTGGADNISGSNNADILRGAFGNDTMDGRGGNDLMNGGSGDDAMFGGDGLDIADYENRNVPITVNLNLSPAEGRLVEDSVPERDTLFQIEGVQGSSKADVFFGDISANLFRGLGGKDRLTGGGAADTFDYNAPADSSVGANRDVITDFVPGQDKIDVETIDANTGVAGNQTFAFLVAKGANFTGAAQLRWRQEGAVTLVEGNVNANLAADFQIELSGLKSMTAANFVR